MKDMHNNHILMIAKSFVVTYTVDIDFDLVATHYCTGRKEDSEIFPILTDYINVINKKCNIVIIIHHSA